MFPLVPEELSAWIVENMRDAVVVTDAEGHVVVVNRAARELGIDVDWLLRQELLVPTHGRSEVSAADALGTVRQLAIESIKKNGHTLFVIRDVTLEGDLAELRRMESLGLVSASALHDFNNLLTAIIGSAVVLERQIGSGTPAATAMELRRTTERAAAISRQILAFSRRPRGLARPLDPATTVTELEPLLARVAGDGVELRLEIERDAGMILADREHFDHALLALAASARESMPRGGKLTVSVATLVHGDEGAIDVPRAGSYLVISVGDTGVGMTPDARERIFERLLANKARGTGSGIAAAQRFANENGGCITVRSELAHGTTVILYLPRLEGEQLTPSSKREREIPGGNEAILVVEDERHLRSALCLLLTELGYDATGAESGTAAQEAYKQREYDLVLSDVVMPGVHGRDLGEWFRDRSVPVVFMSGHAEDIVDAHGLSEWGPLLRKPFTPFDLAKRLRDALDR